MIKFLLAFVLLTAIFSVPNENAKATLNSERPTVNLPVSMRQENWLGSAGEGSCVWASTISLLHWQGRYKTADWIRNQLGNGEDPLDWSKKMDTLGVRYAYTVNADVNFLDWSLRTRRGCAVVVRGGRHMINLVHFDAKWAGLLDNNDVEHIKWVPRETFLAEWVASGGWALAVLYNPAAPI